ncbi:MAG: hypothetical protein DMF49_05225 [Acidobacteria bacterium]|nr:MAG: hypothetical protein DMF49_05225 [Acidobacteriota bacterium]
MLPARLFLQEPIKVLLPQIAESELPAILVGVELLGEGLQAVDLGLQLRERPRAERPVHLAHPVEESDLRLPLPAALPRESELLVDQGLHVGLSPGPFVLQEPLEEEIGGPHRHIGAGIRDQHGRVHVVQRRMSAHGVDEAEGVPDAVAVPPFGVASARTPGFRYPRSALNSRTERDSFHREMNPFSGSSVFLVPWSVTNTSSVSPDRSVSLMLSNHRRSSRRRAGRRVTPSQTVFVRFVGFSVRPTPVPSTSQKSGGSLPRVARSCVEPSPSAEKMEIRSAATPRLRSAATISCRWCRWLR